MARRLQLTILVFAMAMMIAAVAVRTQRPVLRAELEPEPVTYRIDVNHADADTLCLLPGVGPGIARRIITHRESAGTFESAAELEEVSGIGTKTRAAIEPWVGFDE